LPLWLHADLLKLSRTAAQPEREAVLEIRAAVFEAVKAYHTAPALLRRAMLDDTLTEATSRILAALKTTPAPAQEREAVLEGWLVERLSGEGYGKARKVLDARQYDPSKPGFFLNEEARGQYRVSPLFAALTTPA